VPLPILYRWLSCPDYFSYELQKPPCIMTRFLKISSKLIFEMDSKQSLKTIFENSSYVKIRGLRKGIWIITFLLSAISFSTSPIPHPPSRTLIQTEWVSDSIKSNRQYSVYRKSLLPAGQIISCSFFFSPLYSLTYQANQFFIRARVNSKPCSTPFNSLRLARCATPSTDESDPDHLRA
jgi:hypothetical protein